jgi:uncharacterized protein (UPF0303 family)
MGEHDELLASLGQEEEHLQFTAFTNETAFEVGMRLVDEARRKSLAITIDITRTSQQLFHCAMPGTSQDNDEWIQRKNRVVYRFGHSSYYMGVNSRNQNTTIQEKSLLDPTLYAPHGGAFPVTIRDVGVVGTVTVSGLPQEEDHKLVVGVLKEFLKVSW